VDRCREETRTKLSACILSRIRVKAGRQTRRSGCSVQASNSVESLERRSPPRLGKHIARAWPVRRCHTGTEGKPSPRTQRFAHASSLKPRLCAIWRCKDCATIPGRRNRPAGTDYGLAGRLHLAFLAIPARRKTKLARRLCLPQRFCGSIFVKRLVNAQILISLYVLQNLVNSARPLDFNRLRARLRTEPEVQPLITRRKIAACGCHGSELRTLGRYTFDGCSNRVAIALVSYQLQSQPMILRFRVVMQDICGAVVSGDDRVQPSIVIKVANG